MADSFGPTPRFEFGRIVKFQYKNYRGETDWRYVMVQSLEFIVAEEYYGPEPHWFLRCWDYIKMAPRSFLLERILPATVEPCSPSEITHFYNLTHVKISERREAEEREYRNE